MLHAGPILAQIVLHYLPELNIPDSAKLMERFMAVHDKASAFRQVEPAGVS